MPQRFADALVALMLVRNGYRVAEVSPGLLRASRGVDEFEVSVFNSQQPLRRQKKTRLQARVDTPQDRVRLSPDLAGKILLRDPKVAIELLPAA